MEYFENGTNKIEATMVDGDFAGLFTIYHPNGKVWMQGGYKNGLKEGKWTTYSENGQVEEEQNFKGGVDPNAKLPAVQEEDKRIPEEK